MHSDAQTWLKQRHSTLLRRVVEVEGRCDQKPLVVECRVSKSAGGSIGSSSMPPVSDRRFLTQAERDLLSAEHSLQSEDFYLSAFMCQQAVEKGLKAIYMKSHTEVWKIHDLVKLAKEVKAPQNIIEKCAEIAPVYAEVRYPESDEMPSEKVNKEEADAIIRLAKEVLAWIKKQC